MVLRSKNWVSSAVLRDDKVRATLDDISRRAGQYKDAGSPSLLEKPRRSFLTSEVALLRPNGILFFGVVFLFAASALAYSWAGGRINALAWADVALKVVVPIFVLGISVVNLTRSLGEAGKFTGEYLNDACRMPRFCCLTFVAAIMALLGWLAGTISWPNHVVAACVAAGSAGAAMICLGMLAFVIRETIRCLVPNQAIKVVSGFAAAKLCYAYLKEVYVRLLASQHNAYLEKWCTEHCKAIHPPSQYYGHYSRSSLGSDKEDNSCIVSLRKPGSDANTYKDFHLGRLAELEAYLSANDAELYLSSPPYESDQGTLGTLSVSDVTRKGGLRKTVERMGKRAVHWRSFRPGTEVEAAHRSHLNALETALCAAIDSGETDEVTNYLQAATRPLSIVRQVKQREAIRGVDRPSFMGYDLVRLHLVAVHKILDTIRDGAQHPPGRATDLARSVLKAIWEETWDILRDVDYHTMELFTWLVPQIYRAIQEAGQNAGPLQDMRAQFGGFYAFADGRLEAAKSKDTQAVEQMRFVLHDGLTKWLLMAIEQKDRSFTKQLCDAARMIVFGRKGDITFECGTLVARHFVLAGYLIAHATTEDMEAAAIERLFCESNSHNLGVKFDDLVTFYRSNPFPPEIFKSYLDIFFTPQQKTTDLLTGSSHSLGFGMIGQREMALAFIYVGACALAEGTDEPKVIPEDMSFELNDDCMKTVIDLFESAALDHGIEHLKAWRDACKKSNNEADTKAIADAPLDRSKVEEWRREFWETYPTSSPVLSLCLRNGNYEIVSVACTDDLRYQLSKIAVINWKYPVSGADGPDVARELAQHTEGQLLAKMTMKIRSPSKVDGTLADLFRRAVAWLKKAGCEGEKGMIVAMTKHAPDSKLFRDDGYVPSWRGDVQSRGFNGFYEGFPVVWYRQSEGAEEDGVIRRKSHRERVVAVDLRGWKGVNVRERIITQQEFGELTIRPWTEEEIQKFIESEKLKPEDVDKAKGNCPADICLYWELSSAPTPRRRAFQIQVPTGEVPVADDSQPPEQ